MAIQSFQLDPAAGGVSQSEFDNHTHSYRRLTRVGVDGDNNWASPAWQDITGDGDTYVVDSPKPGVGVTVDTASTGTPT